MRKAPAKLVFPKKANLFVLLAVIGILIYSFFAYYPQAKPDIFVVNTVENGNVTLSGTLLKDSQLGEDGNYYLEISDGSMIFLGTSISDLDALVGQSVEATGTLSTIGSSKTMTVTNLTAK